MFKKIFVEQKFKFFNFLMFFSFFVVDVGVCGCLKKKKIKINE